MALMTGEQYTEGAHKISMEVYMFDKKVENPADDPILRPSLNSVRMICDLAQMSEYQELTTVIPPEASERTNRLTHIRCSTKDPHNKMKTQRLLGQKTAIYFQRCVGTDAPDAEYFTTYETDEKYGTGYHENFKKSMLYCQENDLIVNGAMTDVKGDRSRAPHAQDDPDMSLHVVERRPDDVAVCGARARQTGIIGSHKVIVIPTQPMGPDDKDYAIPFVVPSDIKGPFMTIGRQGYDIHKLESSKMDVGNNESGGVEVLTVFGHVSASNDRIFVNRETEYADTLMERLVDYCCQSHGGRKVGAGDALIGTAVVAADYNGANKTNHIRDKLIEMTHLNETLHRYGITYPIEGTPIENGNYMIGLLLASICKQNMTHSLYEIVRLAEDITGGLVVTTPGEADSRDERPGPVTDKHPKGVSTVSTENRLHILCLIENLFLDTAAVGYHTKFMHGVGSPWAQRIMISRQGNLAHKKKLARAIAHIKG